MKYISLIKTNSFVCSHLDLSVWRALMSYLHLRHRFLVLIRFYNIILLSVLKFQCISSSVLLKNAFKHFLVFLTKLYTIGIEMLLKRAYWIIGLTWALRYLDNNGTTSVLKDGVLGNSRSTLVYCGYSIIVMSRRSGLTSTQSTQL